MIGGWFGARRQRRIWIQKRREFVYLDEVSVTSLVAARESSIAESYKNTLSDTTTSESGSSYGVSDPTSGIKANWSSKNSFARTTAQEVVRRAVIQGTFRDLRIGDTDLKLSVDDQVSRTRPKPASSISELKSGLQKLVKQRRAIRVCDIERGDVLEVRVDLDAERSYQITAAMTSIVDLMGESGEKFGMSSSDLAEGKLFTELLRRFLVDLVPVAASVTSHQRITLDGEPWLVDTSAVQADSPLASAAEDVTLAGVTELPLYWKDVRRILFDGSSYCVYARVAKNGLQKSWSPVKLADLFERIFPDLGRHMRELPHFLWKGTRSVAKTDPPDVSEVLLTQGLAPFATQLATLAERTPDADDLAQAMRTAANRVSTTDDLEDVGIVRAAFGDVVKFIEDGEPIDRELIRNLRELHQKVARLQAALNTANATVEHDTEDPAPTHILEVEFIAIYW
jgi:hypothetical protein